MVITYGLGYIFEAMAVIRVGQRRNMREVLLNGKKHMQRQFCIPGWSDMWGCQFGHKHSQEDYSRSKHLEESR